jgi:hypothetical protein
MFTDTGCAHYWSQPSLGGFHKLLFSLVVLASLVSLGWVPIIYILSFHAARRLVEANGVGYMPTRPDLPLAWNPALRRPHLGPRQDRGLRSLSNRVHVTTPRSNRTSAVRAYAVPL